MHRVPEGNRRFVWYSLVGVEAWNRYKKLEMLRASFRQLARYGPFFGLYERTCMAGRRNLKLVEAFVISEENRRNYSSKRLGMRNVDVVVNLDGKPVKI